MVPQRHIFAAKLAFARQIERVERTSRRLVQSIRPFLERAVPWWIVGWMALAWIKIAQSPSPVGTLPQFASVFLPYALIALVPPMAMRLAEAAFPHGEDKWAPAFRFARVGRWRTIDIEEARRHPMFGPVGFMASLLIGMWLNVVLRSAEFVLAVPAMSSMAPDWAQAIFLAMAFEVIAMSFLYVVCFVMALRTVPLFPRMLAVTWGLDLILQLNTAHFVMSQGQIPGNVAQALGELLQGNVIKVLISILVWLPYLMLSDRVNVTYRRRVAS